MGRRLVPDPVEIRDQINRLREDIANWRALIQNAKERIAKLRRHDYAEDPPPPESRPVDEYHAMGTSRPSTRGAQRDGMVRCSAPTSGAAAALPGTRQERPRAWTLPEAQAEPR